jgi:hypothetical protein
VGKCNVILIHDPACPNVAAARSNLRAALDAAGQPPRWREFDRNAADTPAEWRAFGSPTILVDGRDVAGTDATAGGNSCRVYRSLDGRLIGVPSVEQITAVLHRASAPGWKAALAVLPAFAVALLPSMTCPACWPAYAALLSSLGVGFLPTTPYLLPLTLVSLAIPLGVLAVQARRGYGYLPLVLGVTGALLLMVGRFAWESNPLLYSGLAALVIASAWGGWSRRKGIASRPAGSCPACSLVQITNQK